MNLFWILYDKTDNRYLLICMRFDRGEFEKEVIMKNTIKKSTTALPMVFNCAVVSNVIVDSQNRRGNHQSGFCTGNPIGLTRPTWDNWHFSHNQEEISENIRQGGLGELV